MEVANTAYDIINLICNIVTAICAIIGLVAIFTAKAEYDYNKTKESAQKAIDMAGYFMNNILTELSLINQILQENGISEIIKPIKFYDMVDFDMDEMKQLFDEKQIRKLKKVMNETKINVQNFEGGKVEIPLNTFVSRVLNKLEYMCMHFSSDLADDDYIYNSLHQVFITSMQACYYSIAELNVSNKDKYYTNIISVYNKWAQMYYEAQEKEEMIEQETAQKKKEVTKPSIKSIKK